MQIVRGRRAAAEHLLPFGGQLVFDLRVLGDQIPTPRERQRRCLVPGEVERHHLVAKLPIGHARAVVVLGVHQPGEQIVARFLAGPAVGDEAVDDLK